MTEMISSATQPDSPSALFRTVTGTRTHLPECPHLVGVEVHPATPAERLAHPTCEWSRAQLGGYGREHFRSLEDAMRCVGVPVEAHEIIAEALRFVETDEIFVVHSLTYGALARDGRTVASFGKTFYWVGDRRVNLPSYVATARSGHTVAGRRGDVCPECFMEMNLLGECDCC